MRMLRRARKCVIHLLTLLSLAVLAATVILGIRSQHDIDDEFDFALKTGPEFSVESSGAMLTLQVWRCEPNPRTQSYMRWSQPPVGGGSYSGLYRPTTFERSWGQFKFFTAASNRIPPPPTYNELAARVFGFPVHQPQTVYTGWLYRLEVPAWSLFLLTLVLPLWQAVSGYRRFRAVRHGCCARCGYDLRATPGRCPECGRVPAIPAPPT
jgi:hypothetical protein